MLQCAERLQAVAMVHARFLWMVLLSGALEEGDEAAFDIPADLRGTRCDRPAFFTDSHDSLVRLVNLTAVSTHVQFVFSFRRKVAVLFFAHSEQKFEVR